MIIPAIDLKDGRCVRLRQGDMRQETSYSNDAAAMASHWEAHGAQRLHVVDLNGALEGQPRNFTHIQAIVQRVKIPVQVGGGIRSLETIRSYIDAGVERVVLGTAALEHPELLARASDEFPSRVLVGIDVKAGKVAVRGWTDVSDATPEHILSLLAAFPLAGIVFTEISRDGMLEGPNLGALREVARLSPFPLIASGGISCIDDIKAVRSLGENIAAAIVGKALYEGTLTLAQALQAAATQ